MGSLTLMGAGPEGAGSSFTPSQVAGLQFWVKADAGTSSTTDGTALSAWNDQSGNARNLGQATGGNQPVYKAAIQNGLPVVRFNGTTSWMNATGFTISQPATYFVVCVFNTTYAANTAVFDGGANDFALLLNRTSATAMSIYAGTSNISSTTTPQSWHSYSCVFNGASSNIWTDGAANASGNAGGNTGVNGITVGASGSTHGSVAQIDVGELLLYNGALSTTDRQSVESYLRTRWGTP